MQQHEEEKILLTELDKQFPDIENKGYDNRSLKKKRNRKKYYLSLTQEILMEWQGLKTIQGYGKRMKLQTKKAFDSHGLKASLHRRFLRWFQARFCGDFK